MSCYNMNTNSNTSINRVNFNNFRNNCNCNRNTSQNSNEMCNCNKENKCDSSSNNSCVNNYSSYYERYADKYPIGMAYVPWQEWKNVMCAKDGMCHGTIFSDLVLPFYGYKWGGRG